MNGGLKHDIPTRIWKIVNLALMVASFALVWYPYYSVHAQVQYYRKGDWVVLAIFTVLYFVLCRSYEGFNISTSQISEIVYSQFLALLVSDFVMFMFIWLVSLDFPNVFPMLMCIVIQIGISILWAFFGHHWYYWVNKPKKSAVIFELREGFEKLVSDYGMEKKYNVQDTFSVDKVIENIDIIDQYETVFMAGIHSHDRNIIIKHCVEKGIEALVIPRVGDVIMGSARTMHMFHLPIMQVRRYRPLPEYIIFKRVFDIICSLIFLIIFAPFMLITAIAVKSDGGPALYKQKRLTKDGKEFYILKFRSMRVDAEKDGVARLSTGSKDDRITKVGKVIRAIRFDELPQVFNILKGEMSIVGPRPERPEIAAQYEKDIPEFRLRLQAKAGLTGYAQVYGKYNTTPYDKLLMDLMYIGHPSIVEDLRICFATVKILFMKDSTEGVEEGKTTAS